MVDCEEGIKKVYSELDKIKKQLDQLPLGEEDYVDASNFKLVLKFKPQYEKLLNVLEDSKSIASCPVIVIKPDEEVGCVYQSPLEPLILGEYTNIPIGDEKYSIIDKIKYYAKNNRIDKIKKLVDDMHSRFEAIVKGIESCPIDWDEEEEPEFSIDEGND